MKKKIFTSIVAGFLSSLSVSAEYKAEKKYFVDGEYRGRMHVGAEYVLSGQFRKDIGELPAVKYHYLGEESGFDKSRLTKVPKVGVHPRVLMSPEDIVRIRGEVKKGAAAGRYFNIVWNDIKNGAKSKMLDKALVALVMEDDKLGRECAKELTDKALFFEPMVDLFNNHPDMEEIRDNWYYYARSKVSKVGGIYYRDAYEKGGAKLIAELAKKSVDFGSDGDKQSSGYLFNCDLSNYDYLYDFMTEEQRKIVRRVISKITKNRYTAGMELPGNMFINNHMSMGEDLLLLNLAIEGEEGFEPRLLKEYAISVEHKINYDISEQGFLHEKCKGFIPERATIAIGRRLDKPLLRNNHLMQMVWAKVMDSSNIYNRYIPAQKPLPYGEGNKEARRWYMGAGSGPWMDQFFNWAFVMKHYYPNSEAVDYFYKSRLRSNGFGSASQGVDKNLKIPRIRYTHRDVMLMTVCEGMKNDKGQVIDYDRDGLPKEVLSKTNGWIDYQRGVGMARSSWDKDALTLRYEARSDAYSAGHETPEAGDFYLFSHGVEWTTFRDWYHDAYFRNTVLVDGLAGTYPPVAAELLKSFDNEYAATFISDNTNQYNWKKQEKSFQLWHPMFKTAGDHMIPFKLPGAMRLNRDFELPFQKHMKVYMEGFAGLDWGNWHGETRGTEMYERWNNIDHAFRTMHMTKGEKPYVLVIDDIKKDGEKHQYDWVMKLTPDLTLFSADSSVKNRFLAKGAPENRTTDLIICLKDVKEQRFERYGFKSARQAKKGDPMLLVRVLWRNTPSAYPQPSFEQSWGPARIKIPSFSVEPEFKVLLYPHRYGDSLPLTTWSEDKSQLSISIDGRDDRYDFGKTDKGRTVFTMERQGKLHSKILARPAKPVLVSKFGHTWDKNFEQDIRKVVLSKNDKVTLASSEKGQFITYTTDGSEPTEKSKLYSGPISLEGRGQLKAKSFARYWPFNDDKSSEAMILNYQVQTAKKANTKEMKYDGLRCKVYEIRHTIFDKNTGLFTGKKNSLPKLTEDKIIADLQVDSLLIPKVNPQEEVDEMCKAYYHFTASIEVPETGLYGFKLNSCGPIDMKVGGESVINVTGQYGLSQKDRFGQVVLEKGRHEFDLVVCDPVFWKGAREENYHIALSTLKVGDKDYSDLNLAFVSATKGKAIPKVKIPSSKAIKSGDLQAGFTLNSFQGSGTDYQIQPEGVASDFFDVCDKDKAYQVKHALAFEPSHNITKILQYKAWFIAAKAGIYEFKTQRNGALELTVGNNDILSYNTNKAPLNGKIYLEKGLHDFDLRIADSSSSLSIKFPGDDEFSQAKIGMFATSKKLKEYSSNRQIAYLNGEKQADEKPVVQGDKLSAYLRKGSFVKGYKGMGMKLSGKDTYLEIAGLLTPEDECSVSFWINIQKAKEAGLISSSWGQHPSGRIRGNVFWAEYFRGSPLATFDIRQGGIKEGQWFHVTVAYDSKVSLFINGELKSWSPKTAIERTAYLKTLQLFKDADAIVDEVRVFNKALDVKQVKELYQSEK